MTDTVFKPRLISNVLDKNVFIFDRKNFKADKNSPVPDVCICIHTYIYTYVRDIPYQPLSNSISYRALCVEHM